MAWINGDTAGHLDLCLTDMKAKMLWVLHLLRQKDNILGGPKGETEIAKKSADV